MVRATCESINSLPQPQNQLSQVGLVTHVAFGTFILACLVLQ